MDPNPIICAHRKALRMAIASTCVETGFSSITESALETITEMTVSYIHELARSSRGLAEVACRQVIGTLAYLFISSPLLLSCDLRDCVSESLYFLPQNRTDGDWHFSGLGGDGLRRNFVTWVLTPTASQTVYLFRAWCRPWAEQAENASSWR